MCRCRDDLLGMEYFCFKGWVVDSSDADLIRRARWNSKSSVSPIMRM